jgi:ketosteroid isomerase-like protein
MPSRTRRILCLMLALAMAGGCADEEPATPPPPTPEDPPQVPALPWGAEAVARREALVQAQAEGIPNVLRFYAEDFVFEDRTGGEVIRGRDDFIDYAMAFLGSVDHGVPLQLFLSADESLDQYVWPWFSPPVDFLDRTETGRAGTVLVVNAGSIRAGRAHDPWCCDFDAIEALADRWLVAWNGSDPSAAAELYVPDARIDDTLLGGSVAGAAAIMGAVGSEGWPDLPPMSIADLPGRAGSGDLHRPGLEGSGGAVLGWGWDRAVGPGRGAPGGGRGQRVGLSGPDGGEPGLGRRTGAAGAPLPRGGIGTPLPRPGGLAAGLVGGAGDPRAGGEGAHRDGGSWPSIASRSRSTTASRGCWGSSGGGWSGSPRRGCRRPGWSR